MSAAAQHYGIIGGGMLGLTLALRLAQQGQRVTLLEAAPQLGGLVDSWQLDDIVWDRHYHVTLLSDSYLRQILRELELDDQMQWVTTRTGFYTKGRLHSFSSSWDFLKFPALNLWDKARLAWTITQASRRHDWQALEQIPVVDWLTKHSGPRTTERIWLPLLKAKLGDAYQRTSAAFIWATIQRLNAARRSGLKRELFGYLPGGYARLLQSLREKLTSLGVTIQTNASVQSISRQDGQLQINLVGEQSLSFDRVVATTPTTITAQLAPQLTTAERDKLNGIEYLGIICASLLLKKPLGGYYVTNVTDPAPFTGVIEMTALVDPEQFGGRHLVYLPKYVSSADPSWQLSDAELQQTFWSRLKEIFPQLTDADLLAFQVSRARQVFALSTLGYSQRVPPITTSIPGLFVVNSAQILNGTLNVNETVKLAESAVPLITAPLSPTIETTHDTAQRELIAGPR
jgi:protoporphyrinogen oxidase